MNTKKLDKDLDTFIIFLIVTLLLGTIFIWFTLPANIPNHLDDVGNIKDYISKNFLFFISIIGSTFGLAALKLSKHPEMYNYLITLTDENREIQYAIATRLVKVLAIELLLIFGYVEYSMIYGRKFSVIWMMSLVITLIYYGVKSIRNK